MPGFARHEPQVMDDRPPQPSFHVDGNRFTLLDTGARRMDALIDLIATAINVVFTSDQVMAYGWRIPFALGGVFGLVAVYLRRWLDETPVFRELKAAKALSDGPNAWPLARMEQLLSTLKAIDVNVKQQPFEESLL